MHMQCSYTTHGMAGIIDFHFLVCDAEKILVVESIEERKRAKRMMRFFKGVMYMML